MMMVSYMKFKTTAFSLCLLGTFNSYADGIKVPITGNESVSSGFLSAVYVTRIGECGFVLQENDPKVLKNRAYQVRWNCSSSAGQLAFHQALSEYISNKRILVSFTDGIYNLKNLNSITSLTNPTL